MNVILVLENLHYIWNKLLAKIERKNKNFQKLVEEDMELIKH